MELVTMTIMRSEQGTSRFDAQHVRNQVTIFPKTGLQIRTSRFIRSSSAGY